jgi:hypothetical protein
MSPSRGPTLAAALSLFGASVAGLACPFSVKVKG